MAQDVPLTRMERFALRFAELTNEDPRGKWLQSRFLREVSYVWVRSLRVARATPGGSGGASP